MSNKKQTAVEFLVEKINKFNSHFSLAFREEINQAKEMEKEQIEDSYSEGDVNGIMNNRKMAEQYYNETFKI